MNKRITYILIKLLVLVLLFVFAFFTSSAFSSVQTVYALDEPPWYDEILNVWNQAGLLKGDTNGNLRPNDAVTRAEFLAIVNRALSVKGEASANIFADVDKGAWYANDLSTARHFGYLQGKKINDLYVARPNDPITRQEAVSILARLFPVAEKNTRQNVAIVDLDSVSDYAKQAVQAFYAEGYLTGYPDKTIKPKNHLTRAEMIFLFSKVAGEIPGVLPDVTKSRNVTITKGNYASSLPINNVYVIATDHVSISNTNIRNDIVLNKIIKSNISITLENSTANRFIAAKGLTSSDNLFLKASTINQAEMYVSAKITRDNEGNLNSLFVKADNIDLYLNGLFQSVTLSKQTRLTVLENASIETLTIEQKSNVYTGKNSIINNAYLYKEAGGSGFFGDGIIYTIIAKNGIQEPIMINGLTSTLSNDASMNIPKQAQETPTASTGGGGSSNDSTPIPNPGEEPLIDGAYISNGFLHVSFPDTANIQNGLTVRRILNNKAETVADDFTDVHMISDAQAGISSSALSTTGLSTVPYGLYNGSANSRDLIKFDDGKYEIHLSGEIFPVVSVSAYRVNDPGKLTDPGGNVIPFCDNVYPIVYNGTYYSNIRIEIQSTQSSKDSFLWPKILRDGNDESGNTDTYPKDANTDEPAVYTEKPTQTPLTTLSLDQEDMMIIVINNTPQEIYYWDQISKVWFKRNTTAENIDMVSVQGGTYRRGDFRPPSNSYSETVTVNIKKLWLSMLDPQFMGESEKGAAAVGETGLQEANSNTYKNSSSPMWVINDDATDTHNVTVSDFEIGKYEITMDQYYRFVDSVQTSADPKGAYYTLGGHTYTLNDIASYAVSNKKMTARDNGWGMGQRPAIDINWYEALEFCNWLSRVNALEVCYTFTDIYDGAEASGDTEVNFMDDTPGSVMGKKRPETLFLQLVKVDCDFNKNGYRLPTESEFEYAARGGSNISTINNSRGYLISGKSSTGNTNLSHYAWYRDDVDNPQKSGGTSGNLYLNNMGANGHSNPVGTKLPNILGIYDMSGNVWETTWDYYSTSYYKQMKDLDQTIQNPQGPVYRVPQISKFLLGTPPADEKDTNVDAKMDGQYKYTYEKQPDGTSTRTAFQDVQTAGKVAHTLRGGCFTNPFQLIVTVNRYSSGSSFVDNVVNFTDARIGFRVARSLTTDYTLAPLSSVDHLSSFGNDATETETEEYETTETIEFLEGA